MATCYNLHAYEDRELNCYQRAGVAIYFLLEGATLTTAEIATLTDQTSQGAREMMSNLKLGNLVKQDADGRWRLGDIGANPPTDHPAAAPTIPLASMP